MKTWYIKFPNYPNLAVFLGTIHNVKVVTARFNVHIGDNLVKVFEFENVNHSEVVTELKEWCNEFNNEKS